nr:MAG TPA: hypothetical protein [Caudoviricetes sp.]
MDFLPPHAIINLSYYLIVIRYCFQFFFLAL